MYSQEVLHSLFFSERLPHIGSTAGVKHYIVIDWLTHKGNNTGMWWKLSSLWSWLVSWCFEPSLWTWCDLWFIVL